jgi:hypothetical protein
MAVVGWQVPSQAHLLLVLAAEVVVLAQVLRLLVLDKMAVGTVLNQASGLLQQQTLALVVAVEATAPTVAMEPLASSFLDIWLNTI